VGAHWLGGGPRLPVLIIVHIYFLFMTFDSKVMPNVHFLTKIEQYLLGAQKTTATRGGG